jgi:hypothetical protein
MFGQKPSKKDVKNIFNQTINYLQTNDSVAFKNLFIPDTSTSVCQSVKDFYDITIIYYSFNELKKHLKHVLLNNIKLSKIDIEKIVYTDSIGNPPKPKKIIEYEITAEYYISETSSLGMSFPCAYYNKRLVFLSPGSYLSTDLPE